MSDLTHACSWCLHGSHFGVECWTAGCPCPDEPAESVVGMLERGESGPDTPEFAVLMRASEGLPEPTRTEIRRIIGTAYVMGEQAGEARAVEYMEERLAAVFRDRGWDDFGSSEEIARALVSETTAVDGEL